MKGKGRIGEERKEEERKGEELWSWVAQIRSERSRYKTLSRHYTTLKKSCSVMIHALGSTAQHCAAQLNSSGMEVEEVTAKATSISIYTRQMFLCHSRCGYCDETVRSHRHREYTHIHTHTHTRAS